MDLLAFLTVPAIAAVSVTEADETLPAFKRRWWHSARRLDARPVVWSLRNRPQDWEWAHREYTIRHKPSDHVFWVANGPGFYALYEANCSCTSRSDRGRFQRLQQWTCHFAF